MPTISDVYNQLVDANTKLDAVNTKLTSEITATNAINSTVHAGFTNVSQGMQVLANLENETNQLLFHLSKQATTMICILDQISQNTCELINYAAKQTRRLDRIVDDEDAIRDILETVNPAAALDRQRRLKLQAELEKCCPPEPEPTICKYEPCPEPGVPEVKPVDPAVPPFPPETHGHQSMSTSL